jgi:hypothetical protein
VQAKSYGLAAVYQDVMLARHLSVEKNFFLGKLPRSPLGLIDWKKVHQVAGDPPGDRWSTSLQRCASRLANGIPTAGEGYELDAIAAAVVDGASLMGGEGTILGTVLGTLIIATLRNGGNLLGINPFILQIAIGLLIVAAVLIDQLNKRENA